MEGINPSQISGPFNAIDFQGGETKFKDISIGSFQDFNKQEILEKVSNFTLSDDVQCFIDGYYRIFGDRDVFLWKWVGTVYRDASVMLSSVDSKYISSIIDDKILITMIMTILDDIAEKHKDKELLDVMCELLRYNNTREGYEDNEKILFLSKIWNHLFEKLCRYPSYNLYKDIFKYDFNQVLNCIEYSCLIDNNLQMLNTIEIENYDCHNMIVFLLNGIDLMVSPSFNKNELSQMRKGFWYAQQMARIGNWLSTWKREVKEQDYCSGVFAYALQNEILNIADLESLSDDEIIQRIENSEMQKHFMEVWKENYVKLSSFNGMIQSIDMDAYIKGLENVIKFHMASEGLK